MTILHEIQVSLVCLVTNDGRTWTTIANNQSITLSDSRYTTSSDIVVTNTNAYVYYFITFDSTKALDQYSTVSACEAAYGGGWLGTENCNSVQVSEVKYYYDSANTTTSVDAGNGTVANPGTAGATSSLNTSPTVVSTAPGADSVTTTETPGTMVTTTATTRGTTTSVTVISDGRGVQETKRLEVVRTTTVNFYYSSYYSGYTNNTSNCYHSNNTNYRDHLQ